MIAYHAASSAAASAGALQISFVGFTKQNSCEPALLKEFG